MVLVELSNHRAADRRLSGADVAGEDDEGFAAADGLKNLLDGRVVRVAQVEKRVGGECER